MIAVEGWHVSLVHATEAPFSKERRFAMKRVFVCRAKKNNIFVRCDIQTHEIVACSLNYIIKYKLEEVITSSTKTPVFYSYSISPTSSSFVEITIEHPTSLNIHQKKIGDPLHRTFVHTNTEVIRMCCCSRVY